MEGVGVLFEEFGGDEVEGHCGIRVQTVDSAAGLSVGNMSVLDMLIEKHARDYLDSRGRCRVSTSHSP